ncbi:MAG: hypothetical protein WD077_15250 [Bacteroidia bacterium]
MKIFADVNKIPGITRTSISPIWFEPVETPRCKFFPVFRSKFNLQWNSTRMGGK